MLLDGKVAIITGSGRGIGREHALLMAQHGAKVVVNDLGAHFDGTGQPTATPAQDVVAEIKKKGGEAVANGDSVADFKAAKRIVECALDTFGKLNIVVNNAGILRDRMIFNMAEEDWDAVVAVHLKGTFNMCRHASEYWREEHKKGTVLNGRIINTSSDAGLLGNVGQVNYGACKAAVALMAIVIGQEMKKYGVTANAIAPLARTRLTVDATPSTAAIMGQKPPEGEFDVFDPRNVSPLVTWLSRDGSLVSLDARLVLREVGIELPPGAGATDLKTQRHLLASADTILVMTEEQRRMLAAFPEAAGKPVVTVRELAGESGDIADPSMQDEDVFRRCRDEITRCLALGVERLLGT